MKTMENVQPPLAAAIYYYAYLNDQDVVQMIVTLPSQITDSHYISIPTNDQSLIGKWYNRQTGEFEDIMFYYALLDDQDIVTDVIALPSQITDPKKILIPNYDLSLVGKWYDRANGIFIDPPIHVLAKLNTGEINTLKQDGTPDDKWLQTKLNELDGSLTSLDSEIDSKVAALDSEIDSKVTALDSQINSKVAALESSLNAKIALLGDASYSYKYYVPKYSENLKVVEELRTITIPYSINSYMPKKVILILGSSSHTPSRGINEGRIELTKENDGSFTARGSVYCLDNNSGIKDPAANKFVDFFVPNANKTSSIFAVSSKMSTGMQCFLTGFSSSSTSASGYIIPDSPSDVGNFRYDANGVSFDLWCTPGEYTKMSIYTYIY